MPGPKTKPLLILLILSAGLHLFRLSEPRAVVFDEVHFGGFVNAYCGHGRYFFDIHPPHAKLLIAAVATLGGYRGAQSFQELNEPITEVSPALPRLLPALAGVLLPAVLFAVMLQLGASPMAAFLAGLAVLFDNALLAQTRIIALDGILLLATFGALACFLAATRCTDRGRRTAFSLLAGLLAGLAVGTKFTGMAALAILGVCLAVDFLRQPGWKRLRVAASHAVWILAGAVTVYVAGWAMHFALLREPGPGYIFAVPTGDFLLDTVRIHRAMLASNYGLTASHPYASAWWSWPLMVRGVFFWNRGDALIYFLGNPALWWGTTLGLVVVAANLVLLKVTDLRLPNAAKPWPRLLWIPAAGFVISLGPLIPVPRGLFLYHYLTPLLFGLCLVVLWLDHAGWTRPGGWRSQRASFHAATGALLLGFLAMSPFTFAFVTFPSYQKFLFELFPRWR